MTHPAKEIQFKDGEKRGPAAENAAKTHCIRGHEFTPENTRWRTGNHGNKIRDCIKCSKERNADRRRRKKIKMFP